MITKQELINVCVEACNSGIFVTPKHDLSSLGVRTDRRSVNLMGNSEMANYLSIGDFRAFCYSDSEAGHSPDFFYLQPNDPTIVPGSGVSPYASEPTTQCDIFAVPSGYQQGFHCYAYKQSSLQQRVTDGKLTFSYELT